MKTRFHQSGFPAFTLLEMTVVMFVMAIIVGISVYSFNGMSEEDILRRPAAEFQSMVMEAVRRAGLEEQEQIILFNSSGFFMRFREVAEGRASDDNDGLWVKAVEAPGDMRISLRRWRSNKFTPALGQQLVILPGGLCEPLTIRFERKNSWLELSLDALGGGVREEAMEIAAAP
ncbi:general secretion pathway protein GspH [Phragmitibacter flavus]|uniref:General secretion pathway protein GspH n=1 Tax=Phragmitibacter flavus TaxID=2576071 RepID=A0A5R8KG91_9BACT|nr:general secretion pathway protein GspH [Phragmitibacter flavus]TLD71313.1 general secretion pathway protein GspH [Phragmitibacter flavus]